MKLIKKENGDYHLLINDEIKSLQEFNISKEDCDILTLGYSVEKMALERLSKNNGNFAGSKELYVDGFNTYKELVKDKLFTIEDIINVIRMARECDYDELGVDFDRQEEQIIQSLLPKTEWEVEFDEHGKIILI